MVHRLPSRRADSDFIVSASYHGLEVHLLAPKIRNLETEFPIPTGTDCRQFHCVALYDWLLQPNVDEVTSGTQLDDPFEDVRSSASNILKLALPDDFTGGELVEESQVDFDTSKPADCGENLAVRGSKCFSCEARCELWGKFLRRGKRQIVETVERFCRASSSLVKKDRSRRLRRRGRSSNT